MPKNITIKFQSKKYRIDGNEIMYLDENDFIKKYKGLRRICPTTFKYLCFKFFRNESLYTKPNGTYVETLPTSKDFVAVHGNVELHYTIKNKKIIIENLTPEPILLANYEGDMKIYKGIPYMDEKDKFKIDMYKRMEGCR